MKSENVDTICNATKFMFYSDKKYFDWRNILVYELLAEI